eukprot:gene1231-3033_t
MREIEDFSRISLFMGFANGQKCHDPTKRAKCKRCVGMTVDTLMCKICNIQLTSKRTFDEHVGGAKHKKQVQVIGRDMKSIEERGLEDHPELQGQIKILKERAEKLAIAAKQREEFAEKAAAGQIPGMMPAITGPPAAIPGMVGQPGFIQPRPSVQALPCPGCRTVLAVAPGTPRPVSIPIVAEDKAKETLSSHLRRLNLVEDEVVSYSVEEEGLPPRLQYRATGDFTGADGGPDGMSVMGEPRPSRDVAEASACVQLVRGIDEWVPQAGAAAVVVHTSPCRHGRCGRAPQGGWAALAAAGRADSGGACLM